METQTRMTPLRFNTGTRLKAAGAMCCIFLFSLGMIGRNPQMPGPDRVLYDIDRPCPVYPIENISGIRNRFGRYAPVVVDMIQLPGEIREVTAYNAGDIDQCSGDPCISASGENLCDVLEMGYKRCAANFVPLGTRLHIESLGEFVVSDRMHQRFSERVDIAMKLDEKKLAKIFGVQRLRVTVLDPPGKLAAADINTGE
jgi:3D (Asp-Asp-Asp) domain-containing protein